MGSAFYIAEARFFIGLRWYKPFSSRCLAWHSIGLEYGRVSYSVSGVARSIM